MIYTKDIPAPEGGYYVLHQDGDTDDIVAEIIRADKEYRDKRFCKFAKQFSPTMQGLRDLWYFVRNEMRYQEDGFGVQNIQMPPALWASRVGDCKSKTLFVNAVLRCIGIPYKIRFVAYGTQKYTHVYTIVFIDGGWMPLDAVYNKFGKEASYTKKKDYDMTKIAKITGTPQSYKGQFSELATEYKSVAERVLEESKQKASYVPAPEFIPFSQLSEGEVKARLILRQMEIQEKMRPEMASQYKEAIDITKRLIYNGGKGFNSNTVTGVIPDNMQAVAAALANAMKDTKPALKIRRPKNSVNGFPYPNAPVIPAMSYFSSDAAKTFFLGRGSDYEKNFNSIIPGTNGKTLGEVFAEQINAFIQLNATSSSGAPIVTQIPNTNIAIPVKQGYYVQQSGAGTTANVQNLQYGLYNQYYLNFYSTAYKSDFEDRIKAASGIYDEYLNKMFDETKGLGGSIVYSYAPDVNIGNRLLGLNNYPAAVSTKYGFHQNWVNGCSFFTGLSGANIKNLGTNSVLQMSNGKTPQEMLSAMMQGYNPNIGVIGVDDIAIIIGIIVSLVTAASQLMKNSKKEAEAIEQEGVPSDWVPVGPGLEFMADDWNGNPAGAGNNGAGTGTTKDNNLFYLGGAAAAYGLYILLSKKQQ